jgi:two-component system chemotaxis response regulator CheB
MPIRVLLADDSAILRKALSRFLTAESDIELVGVAEAVSEALNILREQNVDVLVFDLHMAVRREDWCGDLKAISARLPLVAISLDADEEAKRRNGAAQPA